MIDEKKCVGTVILLHRLSLISILYFLVRKSSCTFYWDPYSISQGLFVSIFIKIFGRKKVSYWVTYFASLAHLKLLPIPHGDCIRDYHELNVRSESETRKYVSDYYKEDTYKDFSLYGILTKDTNCLASMTLKEIGRRLKVIIENICILKIVASDNEIILAVERGAFPDSIINKLKKDYGIVAYHSRLYGSFVDTFLLGVYLLLKFADNVARVFRPSRRLVKFDEQNYYPVVAVEAVDPLCVQGRSTEPDYLQQFGWESDSVITYIRRQQRHLFSSEDLIKGSLEGDTIDIARLPLMFKDLTMIAHYYVKLIRLVFSNQRSVSFSHYLVVDLDTYIDLIALFRCYPIKGHLYHTLPNGRVSTRYDSGIVTDACRKFDVQSVTYQSRVHYLDTIIYSFDTFDHFFMWGEKWIECYSDDLFISHFHVLGNPGLDNIILSRGDGYRIRDKMQPHSGIIAVFTGDIEFEHPQHYTFDYTKQFMLALVSAVSSVCDKVTGEPLYELHIKPKDPEHIDILLGDPGIARILNDSGVRVTMINSARHDIESVINNSDKVVSIGFTTPGLDALGLGKMSIYFTPYQGIYNELFDESTVPIVAYNQTDLQIFLASDNVIDFNDLSQYLYRPGEVVGPRLVESLVEILN